MKRKNKNIIMVILIVLTILSIGFIMYYAKNNVETNNNQMLKPGNMNSDNTNSQDKSDGNNKSDNTPPEKPSEDNKPNNEGTTPPDMPNMQNDNSNSNISAGYYIAFSIEGLILSTLIIYLIMSNYNKKTIKEKFENKDKIIISVLSVVLLTILLTGVSSIVTNKVILNNNDTKNDNNFNSGGSATYSSVMDITEDTTLENKSYESSKSEENAISVSKANATLDNVKIIKTGDSTSGDNSNFYGTNSGIIAKYGATLTIKNSEISTDADGANGIFSYGGSATTNNSSSDGTIINISDTKITTTGDNAGGIMTTGGGITNATNLDITTSGTSSAAIRSDRGGGTVTFNHGTYKTTGKGSPTIYSTTEIAVKNAKLIATASEGIVIEGKNSVSLENVTLIDTNNELNGQSTTYKNIFLYQSMSGDAEGGEATFTSKNNNITTNKGDTLYVTNTTASITLENNTIINNDVDGYFLRVQKDSWGTSGKNGGDVTLTLKKQEVKGNTYIDNISTLNMMMTSNSYFEGSINSENIAKSIILKLNKSSKIKLTKDTYVTSLVDEDTTYSNIDLNSYKLYVNNVELTK